jgi:hypothetical protein
MISTKDIKEELQNDPVEITYSHYLNLTPSERERLMGKIVKHITGVIEQKVRVNG